MSDLTEKLKQSVSNAIIKHIKSFAFDVKTKFYNKTEVNKLISDSQIDTTQFLDKETYKSENNEDSVKMSDKAIEIKGISDAEAFTYYGKDKTGKVGFYSFPIGKDKDTVNLQAVKLNVKNGDLINIELSNPNSENDLQIQGYEFVKGKEDTTSILKVFNNNEEENFIYNKNNVEFDKGMKIKNNYSLLFNKNSDNGFYESETFSKEDFKEFLRMEVKD